MKKAYHNYCTYLFDGAHYNNRKRSWCLIKHQRKDFSTITSLKVDGQYVISPSYKAETLNNQFFTFLQVKIFLSSNLEPSFSLIGILSFLLKELKTS